MRDTTRYEDELLRLIVDGDDSAGNRRFMRRLKNVLRERFQQVEVYIVSYVVEIL